jgi:membrane fusion protein (multidrug efflux system)
MTSSQNSRGARGRFFPPAPPAFAKLFTGVLLAFALLAAGCAKDKPAPPPAEPPALPDDVATVAADLEKAEAEAKKPSTAITATGELVSPRRSELVARWPGRVEAILALEGQNVRRGQPLLRLETDYLKLNVSRTEADLERAKASALQAEQDFGRKQELWNRKSIPQASFDRSQAASAEAKAALAAAQAAVDLGKKQLQDAVLVAPLDGVVAERRVDVGERLSDGTIAFVIAEMDTLRLRFNLPERNLSDVALGGRVSATVDPYPGETFAGEIVMVGQVIDPATRTFAVEALFANKDRRLRPGLFARVELTPAAKTPVGAAQPAP